MSKVETTKNKLESLFRSSTSVEPTVPDELRVLELFSFSKNFLSAAGIIDQNSPHLFVQKLHLTGQSIELALKASILTHEKPKEIHDLVKLAIATENLGFNLQEGEISAIVLLNHYFYQDLMTSTKYKTRYPAKKTEILGGPVPEHGVFVGIFNSLLTQANIKSTKIDLLAHLT